MTPGVWMPSAVCLARCGMPDYQVDGPLLKVRITFCHLDAVAASFLWHSLRRLTRPSGRAHTFPRARDQPRRAGYHGAHGSHGKGQG